jgi:hypothetical protein
MPIIPFESLPGDAKVWVFAASDPIMGEDARQLLAAVDEWLSEWKAHGEPLTCARDWREDRFLAVGVDQSTAGASGCSVDALFRVLRDLQDSLGTTLVGGGRVFYVNRDGEPRVANRGEFAASAAAGVVDARTIVYDTSVTTVAAYRAGFERAAGDSWHRDLLSAAERV